MQKNLLFLFLLFFGISSAFAQERTISGKITAKEDGSPLPGVTVQIKGTNKGTQSDFDGNYSLQAESGVTLIFSFVGTATQEVAVGDQTTVNVSMSNDDKVLSEVVVTAIGVESNKRALGYSVQNIDGDKVINARETNLVNALNSKVAGVQVVSSSGSPGASANIRIRGNTSINGSNSPLFVVDGVPINNSESNDNSTGGVDNSNRAVDINPNDIASLSILKGPAATSLYGIRAANGAVLITTKRGKTGKAKITFNTGVNVDQVNKLPEYQLQYAQGQPSGGVPIWRGPHTREGFSWGPAISDLEYDGSVYDFDKNGRLVAKGTGNGKAAQAYNPYDAFFVNGYTYDNNLSVSGGTENTNYYFSVGRLDQSGIVPGSTFARTSLKATVNSKITDKLEVGVSSTYINSGGNRIQRGSNISGVMLGLVRNTPTFDIGNGKKGLDALNDPATYQLPNGTQRSYRFGVYDSPFWTAAKNPYTDNVDRMIGYLSVKYDLKPWLKLSYKLGMDKFTDERSFGFDINSASNPVGGMFNWTINQMDLNSDFLVLISKELGTDIQFDAVLGHNYFSTQTNSRFAQGFTFGVPGLFNIGNASDIQATEGISRRKVHGAFADFKLSYKDIFFLNLSGRNDWSSTLPAKNNSFFYPTVSSGIVITDLLGMKNNKILPYAKLRASWGRVGNDAPLYVTSSYYNGSTVAGDGFIASVTFPNFGVNAFERSGTLGNSELKAETTTTIEFGGDFKFLDGRLGLDITYYDKRTDDQIINVQVPASTGFTGTIRNAGVIRNTGWEIAITGSPIRKKDFSWDIDLNFTKYENIVEELAEGIENIFLAGFTSTSSRIVAGKPYGALFGSKWLRDSQGRRIIGANGWPVVDPVSDYVGNPNPDWIMGLRNSFSYKGITLSALLDIRQGGQIWNGTQGVMNYFGTSKISADERDVRGYVFEGVTASGEVNTVPVDFANPALGLSSYRRIRYGFGDISEESIQDGSWVRLRELSISYQLPSSLLEKTKLINGASISFTGRNLWLSTKYTGIDPETNLTGSSNGIGLDYFNMPNTRSYGVNLRFEF